jgi:dsRNA-specific ribonuclease
VREPIQVYLTEHERATLERLAGDLGVSRAEVLRRGIDALAARRGESFFDAFDALIGAVDQPQGPTDVAERHDEYLARDTEQRMVQFKRPSS